MFDLVRKRPYELPLVFIDTETTGLQPEMGHRVVELAAVRWQDGREAGQVNTLLNPGRKIEPAASRVNGITNADLQGQPTFADVRDAFLQLIDGALLVAHNAAFDAGFLAMELFIHQLAGNKPPVSLPNPWLCTLELARGYFRFGRNNLGAIAQRLGVPVSRAHRALSDVYTTAAIFERMVQELDRQGVRTVDDLLYAQGQAIYTPDLPRIGLPPLIQEALHHGHALTMQYRSRAGTTLRTITPLYPTRFRHHTYLVAYCHTRQDQRTFRLDRMMHIQLSPL